MMSGMDDKDDIDDMVTREAMNGLSKILKLIDESHIRPILINISLKIRPCFEKVFAIEKLIQDKLEYFCLTTKTHYDSH